jgi:hypothetical protein
MGWLGGMSHVAHGYVLAVATTYATGETWGECRVAVSVMWVWEWVWE